MPAETRPTTLPSSVGDGHDRLHDAAERARRSSRCTTCPRQRGLDGADELLADPVRLGVGVADPVRVHHDDEVDARTACGPPRPAAGAPRSDRASAAPGHDARRVREGLGDGERAVAGLPRAVVPGLEHERRHRGQHEQQHDRRPAGRRPARRRSPRSARTTDGGRGACGAGRRRSRGRRRARRSPRSRSVSAGVTAAGRAGRGGVSPARPCPHAPLAFVASRRSSQSCSLAGR